MTEKTEINTKTQVAQTAPKEKTVKQLLSDVSFKKQIALALPKHLTADRMCRVLLTEFRTNPMLEECEIKSLLGCIVQCSQLGLEPGNNLGHAYLIPFKNRKKSITECTLIIGYRGLMDLARRSGQILSINPQVIYEEDFLNFEYGLDPKLKHIPARGDRGKMIGAYAAVHLKDGGKQFELMWKDAIDKIRDSSQSASSSYSPWNTHYDEMAKKTVIRRISKYLPCSVEMHEAVSIDEHADLGKQDLSYFTQNLIEDHSALAKNLMKNENETIDTENMTTGLDSKSL